MLEIFQLSVRDYADIPPGASPEDPYGDLIFDYEFAGETHREELSLLVHSWIIDYPGGS